MGYQTINFLSPANMAELKKLAFFLRAEMTMFGKAAGMIAAGKLDPLLVMPEHVNFVLNGALQHVRLDKWP